MRFCMWLRQALHRYAEMICNGHINFWNINIPPGISKSQWFMLLKTCLTVYIIYKTVGLGYCHFSDEWNTMSDSIKAKLFKEYSMTRSRTEVLEQAKLIFKLLIRKFTLSLDFWRARHHPCHMLLKLKHVVIEKFNIPSKYKRNWIRVRK